MFRKSWVRVGVLSSLLLTGAVSAQLQAQDKRPADKLSDNYDEAYQRFLWEAKMAKPAAPDVQAWGWMNSLALDRRARSVNDLVTIRVVESITGSGTADSALAKAGSGSAGVGKIFGIESKLPSVVDPTALIAGSSKTDFKGSGTTSRAGELTALITARVSDVLPNGDLVVEGIREIEINGDRQMVVLTGVVRTADINPSNTVMSSDIGQLRIRYFGNGLMKDNLKPGWLIRILNKVF